MRSSPAEPLLVLGQSKSITKPQRWLQEQEAGLQSVNLRKKEGLRRRQIEIRNEENGSLVPGERRPDWFQQAEEEEEYKILRDKRKRSEGKNAQKEIRRGEGKRKSNKEGSTFW